MNKVLLQIDELLNADKPEVIQRIMLRIISEDGEIITTLKTTIPEMITTIWANKFWLKLKRKGRYSVYENGNVWEYETTLKDAVGIVNELLAQ